MEKGQSNTGIDLKTIFSNSYNSHNYEEGEKVWACFCGKWYEAKVLKVESRMNARAHFVHYLGWNKSWDEWLGWENLRKFTDQEDVHNQLVQCGTSDRPNAESGKKKEEKQSAEILSSEENMDIEIPRILKKQLVDDCEFVTRLGKLVKLPRTPNVNDILKKFFSFREKKDNKLSNEIQQVLSGLRSYFDKALPVMLLYKSERKQYEELCAEHNRPPSIVYGAEHLLRLFVKLPEIFRDVKIEKEPQKKIQCETLGLLKFLQKNQSKFFLTIYQTSEDLDTLKESGLAGDSSHGASLR